MSEETYIEKKITCPSCKTEVEFALKLKNVNVSDIKINTKCSKCGTEINFTQNNLIGIINQTIEKPVTSYFETPDEIKIQIRPEEEDELESVVPSDISSYFEDIEDNTPQFNEYDELENNKKTRQHFNDIFS